MDQNQFGAFWDIYGKVLKATFKDVSGAVRLTSQDLIKTTKTVIPTSAGNNWSQIVIARPVYLWIPGSTRQINFVIHDHPGQIASDASQPYGKSVAGYAYLFAAGIWWVNTPLLAGDVEGNNILALYMDAAVSTDGNTNVPPTGIVGAGAASSGSVTTSFDTGAVNETSLAQLVRAAVTGQDLAAAAGVKNVPISADLLSNVVSSGRNPNVIEGVWANAALCAGNNAGSLVALIQYVAALTAQPYSAFRLATDSVLRGDDGATYSVPGVRSGATNDTTSVLRLLTKSSLNGFDSVNAFYQINQGVDELKNSGLGAATIVEQRGRGFYTSLRGRRFVFGPVNAGLVTGVTAFSGTAAAMLIQCGASKSAIIHRVTFVLQNTPTSLVVICKADTAGRFSAGTGGSLGGMNTSNRVAGALNSIVFNATATAEGGGTQQVGQKGGGITIGSIVEFIWDHGQIIGPSGSFLVHLVGATTAPQGTLEIEYEEAQVQ